MHVNLVRPKELWCGMAKVLFQVDQLSYRGVLSSVLEFAKYNQEVLGNESAIIYNSVDPPGKDTGTKPELIGQVAKLYPLYSFANEASLNATASKFDFCYSQRAGVLYDPMDGNKKLPEVKTTKFGVHSVFQYYQPHGNVYTYISEWLAKAVENLYAEHNIGPQKFVPFPINLPPPDQNLRLTLNEKLGVPLDSFIIGRYGGFETFDLEFTMKAVLRVARDNPKIVFWFVNTRPFGPKMDNMIFTGPLFGQQSKSNYICACDAMLHARMLGESNGLAISEFLFHNKPVLAWEGGFDQNHNEMLKPYDLLYKEDEQDAYERILDLPNRVNRDYNQIVAKYNPNNVMRQFKDVFIDG